MSPCVHSTTSSSLGSPKNRYAAASFRPSAKPGWGGGAALRPGGPRARFGGGGGEAGGGGSRHGLDCLGGVARSLGEDPDAVQLGIGRVFRQLPHRRAETAPRTACKLRQHVLRRLVSVRHRHGSQGRSNEALNEVHVSGGVEIDDELVA